MVALKAFQVDRYLRSPPGDIRMFLVYGSDAGAITERARAIEQHALERGRGETVVRFGSDQLSDNPGCIADEANSASLFGGEPIVSLRVLDGRHNVVGALDPLFERPPEAAWVIVEAGDLNNKSPLRKAFESNERAVTLPTYQLEGQALQTFIEDAADAAGIRLDPAAVERLGEVLGGDRMAIRGELEKLFLYAGAGKAISAADVAAIVGDTVGAETDAVIDAALLGESEALETGLGRLRADAGSFASLGAAALRNLIALQAMRTSVESGRAVSEVLNYARPPVFKNRHPVVDAQLKLWSVTRIANARRRMDQAVYFTRLRPALEDSAISEALHAIALDARRMKQSKG